MQNILIVDDDKEREIRYEEAVKKDILKDLEAHTTSLYFALGKRLWFSQSTSVQCKITHKVDLDVFEGYLLLKKYGNCPRDMLQLTKEKITEVTMHGYQ